MKIKYEIGKDGKCLTPCPNGRSWGDSVIPVSSVGCNKCFYHVRDDGEKQIKECSYNNFKKKDETKIADLAS